MEYRLELEKKKLQRDRVARIEMSKAEQSQSGQTMLTYPRGANCDHHVQYLLDGERKVEEMPVSERASIENNNLCMPFSQ